MELDLTRPATQIAAAILFLVPGLNATWTIERLSGPSRLKGTERLLRALSLSVLMYLAASFWLLRVSDRLLDETLWVGEPIIGGFVILFIAPVALALVVEFLRRNSIARAVIGKITTIDPTPRAWDFTFKEGAPFYARLKLRGGERVGGFFSQNSFATDYPESTDLFLEEAWRLDENGGFVEPIRGTAGLFVPQDSIELVELLQPQEVDDRGR